MNEFVLMPVSLIHFGFAGLALLTGTWVVMTPKGTARHRLVGYVYVVSMIGVLTTAFGMYYLFGRFGIVHWEGVGSFFGIGTVWLRAYLRNWLVWHYLGMSASVTSLYTAFAVEATYRFVPVGYFWWSTLGTSAIVFGVAGWVVFRHMGTYLPQQEQKWNQSPQRA